ncbi:hypothetical protein JHD47_04630 [Sulfurimonas sp. SAG-AH-194-L11]|nr:hypothetical protein [Sulfurimonas sp. SAG-AH-194-L11]MDF1877094.1 hypothetical protein [Sulfurimonas sp. SAG-AH-194-L11]
MALKDLLQFKQIMNSSKPCLCHAFLTIKSKLSVLLNTFIPRCSYYTVCFAFRRSGIHPPLSLSL